MTTQNKKQTLVERISKAIEAYDLIPKEGKVVFALSDGGDSRALLQILTEAGYKERIVPVIVHMGYAEFDASKAKIAAEALGYTPIVANVNEESFQKMLDSETRQKLQQNIVDIKNTDLDKDLAASRCTKCYNSKRIALDNIVNLVNAAYVGKVEEPSVLIFGHHMDDSIESFLKEYLYRKHAETGETYSRPKFRQFVQQLKADGKLAEMYKELAVFVEQGKYATDEPIQELKEDIKIVRPMVAAGVFKQDMVEYCKEKGTTGIRSGCPHSDKKEYHTGREIVRDELGQYFGLETRNYLAGLVMKGLNAKGEATADPRSRDDLKNYKSGRVEKI
jgi:tRNA(Ile)-lysidine synthase TilS/MesJ